MAKFKRASITAEVKILLEITEGEARALDGIFGYNVDTFLKVFYERMGKSYVQPFEADVRSLHATIGSLVSGPLAQMDKARKAMQESLSQKP